MDVFVMNTPSNIFITCSPELSDWLLLELKQLGYPVSSSQPKGVHLQGTLKDCMKLNLHLRIANRVLWEVASFQVNNAQDLYQYAKCIEWEQFIPVTGYFFIDGFVKNKSIRDSRYAMLKLKDAIADRIQSRLGKRPDSGPLRDRICLFIFWHENECTIYFDTSGETLAKHGYRKMPGTAPLQETLAASLLLATGWQYDEVLLNPMCGSGTVAIEAAMMARNIPPALNRTNFGFMHMIGYKEEIWKEMLDTARNEILDLQLTILASDIYPPSLEQAKKNAREAGVHRNISFETTDFQLINPPDPPGVVLMNPEYGERMGDVDELKITYRQIGNFMKTKCQGYRGFIFSGNKELVKCIGLHSSRKTKFFNARLECRLLKYELYEGSKKLKR